MQTQLQITVTTVLLVKKFPEKNLLINEEKQHFLPFMEQEMFCFTINTYIYRLWNMFCIGSIVKN